MAKLRIAMLGQKGFPAVWGGVEVHVTELAAGLARRGHEVTVFVRQRYQREVEERRIAPPPGARVRAREIPSISTKHLDALSHTLLGTIAARRGFDLLHYHAIGPGSMIPLARVVAPRAACILTVHALDWKRDKWAPAAQRCLRFGEAIAVRSACGIIAVSEELARHLAATHRRAAAVIPNGVRPPTPMPAGEYLRSLGVGADRYFLFVGRLVPEKGVLDAIGAFRGVPGDIAFVVAGPDQEPRYAREVREAARRDARVVLAGTVHGARLAELYSNARALVVPSRVEGASLSLLEGLAYGLEVVAADTPENREVARRGGAGTIFFSPGDEPALREGLQRALAAPRAAAAPSGGRSIAGPSWEQVVALTERFYERVLAERRV